MLPHSGQGPGGSETRHRHREGALGATEERNGELCYAEKPCLLNGTVPTQYGEIYNFPSGACEKVLEDKELSEEEEVSVEMCGGTAEHFTLSQEEEDSAPEFVAEEEVEESDLSDLEDWGRAGEESSGQESESEEEEERVVLGRKRAVQIEYETETEPRTKLKALA